MKEGWKDTTFGEFVDCNPKISIKKGEIVENCEMEDINPNYKFLYPKDGKLYNGSNSKFQNEDTVFARITPCLENGKIAQIKALKTNVAIGSTEFFVFRGKSKISDSNFIYYLSKSNIVRDTAVNSMTGASGRQRADLKALKKLEIKVPTNIKHQQRIASILSAYDDLIEVNNKRIELLEQSARELYKEWFVRMRFPNYQNTKFNKGIPEGWKEKRLEEIANIKMGQSPKSEYYNEEQIGLPFHQGVGNYGKRFPSHSIYCTDKKRIAEKGDILFSVRAPVGRINIANDKLIIGRGLAAINHKEKFNSYLFYLLDYTFTNEDIIGNGSIFNAVTKEELADLKILENEGLSQKFDNIAIGFDRKIEILFRQNQQLTEIRNRLLPRLISGKLEVKA